MWQHTIDVKGGAISPCLILPSAGIYIGQTMQLISKWVAKHTGKEEEGSRA